MKILFSEDDGMVHDRARYLRGGLLRNYHQVRLVKDFSKVPEADLWLHGLSHLPDHPFQESVQNAMKSFSGAIAFFRNDDGIDFAIDAIPDELRKRTACFMRNVWPSDLGGFAQEIREKNGFLNPILKPHRAHAGKQLANRACPVTFFGAPTGTGRFTRIDALRLIKQAGLPFTGGLYENRVDPSPPSDLAVTALGTREHLRLLSDARISLVLHGNNPLTFRFFESFSRRCLVVAQDLGCVRFADCGFTAGVHYVAVKHDLSDLVDRVEYYCDHLDEAQKIADAGFRHFKECFEFSGVNLPQPLYRQIVGSWKNISVLPGRATPYSICVKLLLPFIHSL